MLFVLENWRESKLPIWTPVFGQSTSLLKNVYVSYLNVSKSNMQLLFSLSLFTFTQSHGLSNLS